MFISLNNLRAISLNAVKPKPISAHLEYPTMKKKVKFDEVLEFKSIGQPLLNYSSVTMNPKDKSPMHLENGFVRVRSNKCTIAFIIAQNIGLCTLEEGYVKNNRMVVETASVGMTRFTRMKVLALHRTYKLNKRGELEYCYLMETPQTPLTKHIQAVYRKHKKICP